jgi:hypothetical protein
MDRIIFGDNQFFGINHMSEDKAQEQAERFKDLSAILRVIDDAYDCGIRAFMFNTHDRVAHLCDHFRSQRSRYADLRLYVSLPYAHKYANAVADNGIVGALNEFLFRNQSAGDVLGTILRGSKSIVNQDLVEAMKILVDAELRMFRELDVRVVFLQNIVTDLLLGLGLTDMFAEFAKHVRAKHGVEPGFNTMNMPALVDFLLGCGIEDPIVCASINKAGYLMNPGREVVEETIHSRPFRPLAMSILASGAVTPAEAVAYVCEQPNIRAIVFGASSRSHIRETIELIESADAKNPRRETLSEARS